MSSPVVGLTTFITKEVSLLAMFPVYAILIPLIGASIIALFRKRLEKWQNIITVGTVFVTFCLLLLMFKPVVHGFSYEGQFLKGIYSSFDYFNPFKISFKIDPAGLLVALIIALVWLVGTVFSISSLSIEKRQTQYHIFSLATLAASLGAVFAGDLLTLFIFFEGMIFFPYALFANRQTEASVRGANVYAYMGVVSSLCLLMGIFLLYSFTGQLDIQPMAEKISLAFPGYLKYILAALMIFGFGGKAGIFFEHIWMPSAYPEAPAPTAALSSGAMIKVGAYGIFRVVNMLFVPEHGAKALTEWLTLSHIGYGVIWIGILTALLAAGCALIATNAKKILAYSSISQMGYILIGIGCAAYMGKEGAMGLGGSLYHITNHALFKASLFLCIGAVYFSTRELNINKLGGLWTRMPLTALAMLIAVFGISGFPAFNGFASKTLLHHAITDAYHYSVYLSPTQTPDFWLRIAEILFTITSAATFVYAMKLFIMIFIRKQPGEVKIVKSITWLMRFSLSSLSAFIILIGLYPNWLIEKIIGPALPYFGFEATSHSYHLLYDTHIVDGMRSTIPILYNPIDGTWLSNPHVLHNLAGISNSILIGGLIFILGLRFDWFKLTVPVYLQAGFYYQKIFNGFKCFCRGPIKTILDFIDRVILTSMVTFWLPTARGEGEEEIVGEKGWAFFGRLDLKFDKLVDMGAGILMGTEGKAEIIAGGARIPGRKLAEKYIRFCKEADSFDKYFIDEVVNDVGWFIEFIMRWLRKLQTGFVYNYLLTIFISILVIIGIYLLI